MSLLSYKFLGLAYYKGDWHEKAGILDHGIDKAGIQDWDVKLIEIPGRWIASFQSQTSL